MGILLFFFIARFTIGANNYKYDEPTQTLTIDDCAEGGTCKITQTNYRNSGPYTNYKIIKINFGPTEIEANAFVESAALNEVYLSSSIQTIGLPFCRNCPLLKKINVVQSSFFETDEYGVLYSAQKERLIRAPCGIANVVIHPDTQVLSAQAFGRAWYDKLVIPNKVRDVQYGCFYDSNIKMIVFEGFGSLKTLNSESFAIQYSIHTINFPSSLEVVGNSAVRDCRSLKTITFGDNSQLKEIQVDAFKEAKVLEVFNVPPNVTTISDTAFAGCIALNTIHLSASLKSLSITAFSGCSSLSVITIPNENKNFILEEGSLFDSGRKIAYFISKNSTTFKIPTTLSTIGQTSLQSCPNLTTLNIDKNHGTYLENTKMLINKNTKQILGFVGGITDVTIPTTVTSIGDYAAYMLTKIKQVEIPSNIISLGEYSFSGSSIVKIVFKASIHLKKQSFGSCNSLADVVFPDNGDVKIGYQAFMRTTSLGVIDVKCDASLCDYQAFYQSNVKEIYFRGSGLTSLGSAAFADTHQLTRVEFPPSLQNISDQCFLKSTVQYVTFPRGNNVDTYISKSFSDCTNLQEFHFGAKTKSIQVRCFYRCNSLQKVTFVDDCPLTEIKEPEIFSDCQSLGSLVLPKNVISIDPAIFSNCLKLIEINASVNSNKLVTHIGILYSKDNQLICCPQGLSEADVAENIASVGPRCFYQCSKLTELSFPSSSTFNSFADKMFYGCSNLKKLVVPKSVASIEDGAFVGCDKLNVIEFGIGSKLQNLIKGAFSPLGDLNSINLEVCKNLEIIPESCFSGCKNLKEIEFSANLKNIGKNAFAGSGLDNQLTLPASIEFVGAGAFLNTQIRRVKYCGFTHLQESAFGSNMPRVHVPFTYLYNDCMGVPPDRDLDKGCVIRTFQYAHPLSYASQFVASLIIGDNDA